MYWKAAGYKHIQDSPLKLQKMWWIYQYLAANCIDRNILGNLVPFRFKLDLSTSLRKTVSALEMMLHFRQWNYVGISTKRISSSPKNILDLTLCNGACYNYTAETCDPGGIWTHNLPIFTQMNILLCSPKSFSRALYVSHCMLISTI